MQPIHENGRRERGDPFVVARDVLIGEPLAPLARRTAAKNSPLSLIMPRGTSGARSPDRCRIRSKVAASTNAGQVCSGTARPSRAAIASSRLRTASPMISAAVLTVSFSGADHQNVYLADRGAAAPLVARRRPVSRPCWQGCRGRRDASSGACHSGRLVRFAFGGMSGRGQRSPRTDVRPGWPGAWPWPERAAAISRPRHASRASETKTPHSGAR